MMGDDFRSHQVFLGKRDRKEFQMCLQAEIKRSLMLSGYIEAENDCCYSNTAIDADCDDFELNALLNVTDECRHIAIAETGNWFCVYDSSGSGEEADPQAFEDLSLQLSNLAPVVDVSMDDSAAVHFYLYRAGRKVDQFANRKCVWANWDNEEEEERHRGQPEQWVDLIASSTGAAALRLAWLGADAVEILAQTAQVLGWDQVLSTAGYTIDYDGVPVYYREHFEGDGLNLDLIKEFDFKKRPLGSNENSST
jgi:hypothetical protein